MLYTVIFILFLFALLVFEAIMLRMSVNKIGIKVQVNGSRGKSTVTKYITAAFRASELKVFGKVTGEIPTIIESDGTTAQIRRRGPARIQEQFYIIRKVAKKNASVLALECMSIEPLLQKAESTYFRPGIYVITNIRDDHREKMGQTPEQRVHSICQAVPPKCILVTNDYENLELIKSEVEKKKCKIVIPEKVDKQNMGELPFGVFVSNIELAAEVAAQAGMKRDVALKGIMEEIKHGRALFTIPTPEASKPAFLNAFSVNDPESATDFLNSWFEENNIPEKMIFLFNTRSDRPLRTDTFCEWIKLWEGRLVGVVITGTHKERAYIKLKKLIPGMDVRKLRTSQVYGLQDLITNEWGAKSPVIGVGNIKGDGYLILKEFGL